MPDHVRQRPRLPRLLPLLARPLTCLLAVLVLSLPLLAGGASPARAQTLPLPAASESAPEAAAAAPSAEEIEALVAEIEDPERRAALVERLRLLTAAQTGAASEDPSDFSTVGTAAVAYAASVFSGVEEAIGRLEFAVSALPAVGDEIIATLADPVERTTALDGAARLAGAIAAALLAWWLVASLLGRLRDMLGRRAAGASWPARVMIALARLILDLLPIGAFVAGGLVALGALQPSRPVEALALTILNAGAATGVLSALVRMILAPRTPALRALPAGDETAVRLHRSIVRTAAFAIWGYLFVGSLWLLGLTPAVRWGLLFILGVLVAVVAIRFVLRWRTSFSRWLGEHVPAGRWYSGPARHLAASWHRIAILYIVLVTAVFALQISGGFAFLVRGTLVTVLVLALVPLVANRLGAAVEGSDLGLPVLATPRGLRYRALLRRVVVVLLWTAGIVALLEGWHLGILDFVQSDAGATLVAVFTRILIVVFAGFIAWEIANIVIEGKLNAASPRKALGQRGRTLLQFLRNVVMVVILLMVTLIILSEIGVDIGPLLAGAGVIGLAVGFGAQTLVKDVITGLFILMEDQVQVGDVVDLNGNSGAVEAMTIRTIRLRDFSGTVHVIPFSSVDRVKNLTRGFAYSVFDVGVAYKEDIDRVMAVLKHLGEELRADPAFAPMLLGDLEIFGLDSFGASALLIKTRIKTLAGSQWTITREFNGRIKRAFDAEGIEIPFNYQTVTLPTGPDGKTMPIPLEVVARRRFGDGQAAGQGTGRRDDRTDGPDGLAAASSPSARNGH
jgi:small conductance mechanosensitive channel